jgi:hypothetical protein
MLIVSGSPVTVTNSTNINRGTIIATRRNMPSCFGTKSQFLSWNKTRLETSNPDIWSPLWVLPTVEREEQKSLESLSDFL